MLAGNLHAVFPAWFEAPPDGLRGSLDELDLLVQSPKDNSKENPIAAWLGDPNWQSCVVINFNFNVSVCCHVLPQGVTVSCFNRFSD